MRVQGTCGNGNRHYGNAADVLKGRLMDEREPYVIPSAPSEEDSELEECLAGLTDDPDLHEGIDNPILRWAYEIADERYFEDEDMTERNSA